jgi:hypothetical protein
MHAPGVGVVWDSVCEPRYLGSVHSYPLKPHNVAANSGALFLGFRVVVSMWRVPAG